MKRHFQVAAADGATRETCPPGSRAYTVRYVHKISPSPKDTSGPVCINDNAFSNSKTLGAALRKAKVMIGGAQVRNFRVEGDKVIVFPSAPGRTTYWHSIILTVDDDGNVGEARESGGRRVAADDAPEEIGQIGDKNFAEHGGGLVFRRPQRQEDIYGDCFLDYIEPPSDDQDFDDPGATWTVYSVELDPEVPNWGDLKAVAQTTDQDPKELAAAFTSTNPMERAYAYETWALHYGWANFDQYARQLTCAEMNEQYEADLDCYGNIQTELAEVVERMVDQSAATTWSTPGDQLADDIAEEGYDPKSIVILAEFGDATAVNGGIEPDKTVAGLEAELEREGYEYLDRFGGRVPTTEAFAYGGHVVRAVARKLKVPVDQVQKAAEALDWWQEEIPGSTSGHTYVWAKNTTGGAEEARRRPQRRTR